MKESDKIMTSKELEFAIFCIENLAIRHNLNQKEVYATLKNKSKILEDYIIPGYEFLHTQDKDYILNDIEKAMKTKGVNFDTLSWV